MPFQECECRSVCGSEATYIQKWKEAHASPKTIGTSVDAASGLSLSLSPGTSIIPNAGLGKKSLVSVENLNRHRLQHLACSRPASPLSHPLEARLTQRRLCGNGLITVYPACGGTHHAQSELPVGGRCRCWRRHRCGLLCKWCRRCPCFRRCLLLLQRGC